MSAERPTGRSEAYAFAAGDLIGARYRILRFVARGAMGEVYAAEDHELGAVVALKTLRTERADDSVTLARFRREVLLARELTHPGICRIFDIGVHEGPGGRLLFLTMELLAGETLAARLGRIGALAVPAALALAEKLVAALSVAHASGVVHRDLKPANIMLVADERAAGGERVVITDFGLARRASDSLGGELGGSVGALERGVGAGAGDGGRSTVATGRGEAGAAAGAAMWASPAPGERATATGALLGSPAYMAPEQVTGQPIGPAADIYALGVVLFEALTGRLPFEGVTPLGVATLRLERDAPRARSLRGDLEARWDDALARCLAREPGARFARADDLLRALAEQSQLARGSVGGVRDRTGDERVVARSRAADESEGAAVDGGEAGDGLEPRGEAEVAGSGRAPAGSAPAGSAPAGARAVARGWRRARKPAVGAAASGPASSADPAPSLATATALSADGSRRRRRIATTTAVVLGAIALAVVARVAGKAGDAPIAANGQGARVPAPAPARPPAPLLAVVPLRNLSGTTETAWIGTAVSEMLTTELGAGDRLRVVPSDVVAAAARARGVALDDAAGARTAALGAALAADYIIDGSVVTVGDGSAPRVRVELRVAAGKTGAQVARMGADGDKAELFDIIARLGEQVRARLGQEPLTAEERSAATESQPSNLEAARELASGIAALGRYEAQKARANFERAIALEPNNAKYHAALASAWRALQFPDRTRQEAERAFELSAGLPRPERLFIEARHHEAARRFDQAIELYAALVAFFPESIEYRLTLADVQSGAGRPRDALATVDRLRAAGGAGTSDPRVDVLEATAARAVGDNDRAQRAALAAEQKARALAAPAMEAQAELVVCDVMGSKDLDRARTACARAAELGEQVGDRAAVARALLQMALVRDRQNANQEAARLQARALAIYREIGNLRGVGSALLSRGNSLKSAGKLDQAMALQREALAAMREAGDDFGASLALSGVASTLVERGDLEPARKTYLEVIDLGKRVGNDRGVAIALQNLAWVEHDSGQVIEARRHAEEAMAMQERRGEKLDLVFSLDCAAIMALEQDDPDAAEKLLVRALALRDELKTKKVASLQNLSEVRLVQRRIDEAKAVMAQSIAAAAPGSLDEGFAREVEMRILLEAGDLDGAARALARSREITGDRMRLPLDVDQARLFTARGQPRKALAMVPAAMVQARKTGAMAMRMAVEAAQGEAEMALGSKAGAERLAAIEKEASAHGYALMARLVAEVRTGAHAPPRASR
ncbi:MAG TPA: protein kinase [Kofleriaceae bacterium]|nr:protein kinase [Kofleriaceae bacterium]